MTYRLQSWIAMVLLQQAQRHGVEAIDETVSSPRGMWRIRIEPVSSEDFKGKGSADT